MATLSKQGNELFKYFSPRYRGMISVRDNGNTLIKRFGADKWKLLSSKKKELSLEEWTANKLKAKDQLPAWLLAVERVPFESEMREWNTNGVYKTPTGEDVEVDGVGSDGVPSWPALLGL